MVPTHSVFLHLSFCGIFLITLRSRGQSREMKFPQRKEESKAGESGRRAFFFLLPDISGKAETTYKLVLLEQTGPVRSGTGWPLFGTG